MLRVLVIATLALIVSISADDCKPASTDFYAEQCLENPIVSVDNTTVKIDPYPPTASKPITLSFTYNNKGGTYDKLLADVTVEFYGKLLFRCGWHKLPIPLSDLDGCKVADNCPLTPGEHPNKLAIDLTPFQTIIDALAANAYYRLTINVKDAATKQALSCVKASFLLAKSS